MDLIAMLQDETLDDFRNSVDRAIELRPIISPSTP
jgi:coproporphyrinogen III oxidase-like Fe-S oxidoreductase